MSEQFYVGLDVGSKRIGVAVGSSVTSVFGKGTIDLGTEDWREYISQLVDEYRPAGFVLGQPDVKSGDQTDIVTLVEDWRRNLESEYGLPVTLVNESYSSVEAERQLRREGVDTIRHKSAIDERAAMLIVEQYLHTQ